MGSSCKQTHKHLAIEIILHGEVVKVFTALMSETGGQLYKMSTRSNFCYRGQYQLLMPWVYLLFPQHTITSIDNFVEYTTEKAHFSCVLIEVYHLYPYVQFDEKNKNKNRGFNITTTTLLFSQWGNVTEDTKTP